MLTFLGLLACAGQARAGFLNDTVHGVYYFPITSTVLSDAGNLVVNPTATFNFSGGGYSYPTVQVADSSIVATFSVAGGYSTQPFNGFVISDVTRNPGINGISVNSNIGGFLMSDVSYTGNSISVNLSGLTVTTSSQITVTAQFSPSSVPEPSSLVLTGIAAADLGSWARSRRRLAAA